MQSKMRPILVTGAHRTGTTWVGRMLAANPQTAYISEPLNALHGPGMLRANVEDWYTYICTENETRYLPAFADLLSYRYHLAAEVGSLRSAKDFFRMGRDLAIFWRGRLFHRQPLLKDPFAVFSIVWFAERLNCRIVVTIRHPASFTSSLKRLNWSFDFRDLLDQPLLMRDQLEPYAQKMKSVSADDIVGQAALLWTMVYRIVHDASSRHAEFIVVRHEEISMDPILQFKDLYRRLGLVFTEDVAEKILKSSSSENPRELSRKHVHSVNLDSRANLDNWRRRLSLAEIARIRQITESVSSLYYDDSDW